MKAKGSFILSGIGLCLVAAGGLASFRAAAVETKAGSTTTPASSLVPGNLVYLNITAAAGKGWNTTSYNYAFKFDGTTTTSKSRTSFSNFAAHAIDSQLNTFYVAEVPTVDYMTKWTSVCACVFPASATAALDGQYLSISAAITSDSYNEFTATGTNSTVGSSTSSPTTCTLTAGGWQSSNENHDRLSIWSLNFLSDTSTICSAASHESSLVSDWKNLQAVSYAALPSGSKTLFTSATALQSPDTSSYLKTEQSAAGRYDYIYKKYNATYSDITNFASRSYSSSAVQLTDKSGSSSDYVLILVLGISSLVFAGSYFFFKKKKARA